MAGNTKILPMSGLGAVKAIMPRNYLGRRNYLDMRDQYLAHRATLPYMLSSIPVITFSYPLVPPMLVFPFLIPAAASHLTPKAKQVRSHPRRGSCRGNSHELPPRLSPKASALRSRWSAAVTMRFRTTSSIAWRWMIRSRGTRSATSGPCICCCSPASSALR
jgi:hypothetical protein